MSEMVDTGDNWYAVLRHMQGDILAHLTMGVMIDSHDFIMNSLFCEFAYIVNLDTNMFEVYQGFQSTLHNDGRYGGDVPDPEPFPDGYQSDKYYGCRLVKEFPLASIPTDWEAQAFPEDEDDE